MKKLIPFCLAAAFAAPAISFVPANNIAVTPQFAATAEAAVPTVNALITTQQRLAKGTVTIYDYGQIKLHAYQTGDALSDECYVFETKQGLVLLESTILTSHYVPEGQAAVTKKIAYLEKVQQLTDRCKTAQEFTQAVQKAFPDYEGVNYLQMTAGFLYK